MRSLAAGGAAALALLIMLAVLGVAGGAAQPEQPAETLRVELQADGHAEWTVILRLELESGNDTDGFDRLANEFEDGESDVLAVDPYREAADRAAEATGRSMEIQDVSRRAWRQNDTGQLELSFTWTAFARRSGDRLLLGDVFQTDDGTWLPKLEADQAFVVRFPDGFSVVNTSHNIERRAFEIHGPTTFDPGMPSATLVRDEPTTVPPGTPGTPGTSVSPGTNGTPVDSPQRSDWEVIGVGALVILIGALAVLVERRRRTSGGTGSTGGGDDGRPDMPEAADGAGAAGVGAAGAPEIDEEADGSRGEPLLSDDERVLRLLHRNDGRMKQGQIVEETDWSNAKVSQLLSEMSESDQIDKLRIGRENLISLPGEGPDDGE